MSPALILLAVLVVLAPVLVVYVVQVLNRERYLRHTLEHSLERPEQVIRTVIQDLDNLAPLPDERRHAFVILFLAKLSPADFVAELARWLLAGRPETPDHVRIAQWTTALRARSDYRSACQEVGACHQAYTDFRKHTLNRWICQLFRRT